MAGDGTNDYLGDGGPATAAELSAPYGITVDVADDFFIADTNNNCIRKVDPRHRRNYYRRGRRRLRRRL